MVLLPPTVKLAGASNPDSGEEGQMFSPLLLPQEEIAAVEQGFRIRPLNEKDYDKGFLDLLAQLTSVGQITEESFLTRFRSMSQPQSYYVVVIEDESTNKVVGAATLVLEWKFIHEAGARGRIEDVVIHHKMRGRKFGALLIKTLVALGKQFGVYKMSLECKDELVRFYGLNGFTKDPGNFMTLRFDQPELVPLNEELGQSKI
ncbi:unnamed protein product, partial [Mesorhabditis spiculigera]